MRRASFLVLTLLAIVTHAANAQQQRWVIDPKASLAWWQMNPTLGHLWATTCPDEPSWRAGEGSTIDQIGHVMNKKTSLSGGDETRIPLYPRKTVRSLCNPALIGRITVGDTTRANTISAAITLNPAEVITGNEFRDNYGRKAVFSIDQYPEIKIVIDSLSDAQRGPITKAVAHGTWEFRGLKAPFRAPLTLTPQPGGALRVQGQFAMPASDLVHKYGVSPYALGLSVGLRVWKTLNMGLDLLVRPEPLGNTSSSN